jgi:hypothetical protein
MNSAAWMLVFNMNVKIYPIFKVHHNEKFLTDKYINSTVCTLIKKKKFNCQSGIENLNPKGFSTRHIND